MKKIIRTLCSALCLAVMSLAVCFADMNDDLIAAVRRKDATGVSQLVVAGADVDTKDDFETPVLDIATLNRDQATVKLLIENGADVNARDFMEDTSLMTAAEVGDAAIVRMLVDSGADVNAQNHMGQSVLALALLGSELSGDSYPDRDYVQVVSLLKDAGAKQ